MTVTESIYIHVVGRGDVVEPVVVQRNLNTHAGGNYRNFRGFPAGGGSLQLNELTTRMEVIVSFFFTNTLWGKGVVQTLVHTQ